MDMRRPRLRQHALLLSVVFLSACNQSNTSPPLQPPEPVTSTLAVSPTDSCSAPASWFPDTPFPDGNDFPLSGTLNNCAFHQWAYQMFLWLGEPTNATAGAALNFETMASPSALLRPGGPGSTPYPGRAAGEQPRTLVRVAKSSQTVDADDIFQAGPGAQVLVDQAGNVVYYTGLLNQDFWNFVTANQLYNLNALKGVAPAQDFPVNALELKLAWRVAALLDANGQPTQTFIQDATTHFHTEDQVVPVVKVVDGKISDSSGQTQRVLLALIGMHVVGVVKGHPEFVWATFEHRANAPDCSAVPASATDPVSGQPWSLYKADSPLGIQNQFDVNNPLKSVSVCRQAPFGGGNAQNSANIQSLNASVAPHLAGSVWANYQLVGAQWTTGNDDIPGANGAPMAPGDRQIGSLQLANTSMETFTQDANCFACHNAGVHTVTVGASGQSVAAKHLNLSHFIVNYQAWLQAMQNK
ncbi:MAG: hypothetical protein V4812_12695 [Pseudomonadota bacterium]